MKNCEKSILTVYLNIGDLPKDKGLLFLNNVKSYIENQFNYKSLMDITDDSLVILVIPVKGQETKIELLNARYPEYKKILEMTQDILEKEFKNIKED